MIIVLGLSFVVSVVLLIVFPVTARKALFILSLALLLILIKHCLVGGQ